MSQRERDEVSFETDVGKIQANHETGICIFDMGIDDANKLVEFCKFFSLLTANKTAPLPTNVMIGRMEQTRPKKLAS